MSNSSMISVEELKLGDEIVIEKSSTMRLDFDIESPVVGTVIAKDLTYIYIGYHSSLNGRDYQYRQTNGGEMWNEYKDHRMSRDIHVLDSADKFPYYFYFKHETKGLVRLHVAKVINPEQKCSGCGTAAPHVEPNQKDSYVCSICEVINSLEGESNEILH